MNVDKVYAPIRPENESSRKVAEKLGFDVRGEFIKHYDGKDMPHLIYAIDRQSQFNQIRSLQPATSDEGD